MTPDTLNLILAICIFTVPAASLTIPALVIAAYIWTNIREHNLWQRMETELRQERRERTRLELLVDRLLYQLREAGIVPDPAHLYVTDTELTYHQIAQHFILSELRDLAARLSIDYDDLPGPTKTDKARELTAHLHRHNRTPELLTALTHLRPSVAW